MPMVAGSNPATPMMTKYVKYSRKLRKDAIKVLGGRCAACLNDDFRVLTFDHVDGGGDADRGGRNQNNRSVMRQVRDGERDDIQLLCANCHHIKTYHE